MSASIIKLQLIQILPIVFCKLQLIIQCSSTVYKDHEGLGFLVPKYLPQNQLNIYFVTSTQDWLGIAKPKNVFRSIINPSAKLM